MKLNKLKQKLLEYYLARQFGGKYKWTTLEHNGVLFPPAYVPHSVPLLYKGESVTLTPIQEEIAMMYAKYIDTEYIQNKIFNKNFWNEFKKILGKGHIIQTLEDCDFRKYNDILVAINEKKKELKNIIDEDIYKNAIVDGKKQPVGNYRIEPPGIFIGRGCNPNIGKIKRRIYPEDITINIGRDAPVPKPLDNHHWKKVIHDRSVEWLASWKDNITNKIKYVWLGAHSDFKAASDQNKFDLARKLKKQINTITEKNNENLNSSDIKTKQTATALYFIDKLALRVGNEKGEDEADTVGVTSLRKEHIEILDDYKISLDFLGKDSVRYHNTVQINEIVYNNVKQFLEGKTNDDQLFDVINASDINKYLQTFMKGLTAKVFRTFNASYLFQKEIKKINNKFPPELNTSVSILMDEYNKANAKVAMLCNHQKNINKSFKPQIEKLDANIKKIKQRLRKAQNSAKKNHEKIKLLKDKLKTAKSKKDLKMQLKNIALGTSKSNYIDPRITVAFMKLHDIPVEKVFSKALQDKFKWAFNVNSDYKF